MKKLYIMLVLLCSTTTSKPSDHTTDNPQKQSPTSNYLTLDNLPHHSPLNQEPKSWFGSLTATAYNMATTAATAGAIVYKKATTTSPQFNPFAKPSIPISKTPSLNPTKEDLARIELNTVNTEN